MARRTVSLVAALAVFLPVALGAIQAQAQDAQLSITLVEKEARPHKLRYSSATQLFEAEGRTLRVTESVESKRKTVVLTEGSLTASAKTGKPATLRRDFKTLTLVFAANGDMIEFKTY